MKILIITQYFYPDNFLINEIASELVRFGHQVKVLTGLPDYSTSKIPREYKWFRKRRESYNGATIYRVPTFARRTGAFFRILNYMSFVCSASLYALFANKDIDVIWVYAMSPVFQGIPAMVYKWRTGKKSVHYCMDLWPESLKAWSVSEKSLTFKTVKKISGYIYRGCDIVAVTSMPFQQYLIDVCGVDSAKIAYLPQHSDDLYAGIVGRYQDNDCTDFLFAGNLGAVQDIHVIIRAAAIVKTNKKFCVHIVGDGSELTKLKDLAKFLELGSRVIFHGRHSLEDMRTFYRMADCFLLTLRGGDFIGMTLPTKAQGYLCAGKPVLAAIDGSGKELIEQSGCGEVVPAGDVEGLAEKMVKIIENPEKYKDKGRNGRIFYEKHFTKDIFMGRLLELLS
jgi:glycosyltransferase involved in cell wall biosynthesis